jgi:hypothetical protein
MTYWMASMWILNDFYVKHLMDVFVGIVENCPSLTETALITVLGEIGLNFEGHKF